MLQAWKSFASLLQGCCKLFYTSKKIANYSLAPPLLRYDVIKLKLTMTTKRQIVTGMNNLMTCSAPYLSTNSLSFSSSSWAGGERDEFWSFAWLGFVLFVFFFGSIILTSRSFDVLGSFLFSTSKDEDLLSFTCFNWTQLQNYIEKWLIQLLIKLTVL